MSHIKPLIVLGGPANITLDGRAAAMVAFITTHVERINRSRPGKLVFSYGDGALVKPMIEEQMEAVG